MPLALEYTPDADAALSALEDDPQHQELCDEVDDTLARRADEPDDRSLRTKTFKLLESGDVVHVTPVSNTDWVIVWSAVDEGEGLWIRYVGAVGGAPT